MVVEGQQHENIFTTRGAIMGFIAYIAVAFIILSVYL